MDSDLCTGDRAADLEQICQASRGVGSIILMLSSAEHIQQRERFQSAGVKAFLSKPVRQQDLRSSIMIALGKPAGFAGGAAPAEQRSRHPGRILLAEDHPVNQRLATKILEKWGHQVTVAPNGRRALEFHGQKQFDLILMDVQMPQMGGMEATAAIREREQKSGSHIAIIDMTAHAIKGDREKCLAAGMDDFLNKPVNPRELYGMIEKYLGGPAK
jgi:CheY-like chemotaxis protein